MQRIIIGALTLSCAIAVSVIAAYFSIVGLAALFAAAILPVILMGIALEASKLIAAFWVHHNWHRPDFTFIHRTYMIVAIVALMAITSVGIYGFLMNAHMEQSAPAADAMIDIDNKQANIDQLVIQRDQLIAQQQQINSTIASYLESGSARGAAGFMRQQRQDRAAITEQLNQINEEIAAANMELAPLKRTTNAVEAKLGAVKYVAKIFGLNENDAVSIFVVILMLAFDPLAVVLMISGTMTLLRHHDNKRPKPSEEPVEATPDFRPSQPMEVIIEPISELSEEVVEPSNEPKTETLYDDPEYIDPSDLHEVEMVSREDIPDEIEDMDIMEDFDISERDPFDAYHVNPISFTHSIGTKDTGHWDVKEETKDREVMDADKIIDAIRNHDTAVDNKYLDDLYEYIRPFKGNGREDIPVVYPPRQNLKTIDKRELLGNISRDDILDLLEANPDIVEDIVDAIDQDPPKSNGWLSDKDFLPKT